MFFLMPALVHAGRRSIRGATVSKKLSMMPPSRVWTRKRAFPNRRLEYHPDKIRSNAVASSHRRCGTVGGIGWGSGRAVGRNIYVALSDIRFEVNR